MRTTGIPASTLSLHASSVILICCAAFFLAHAPGAAGGENAAIVVRGSSTLQPVVDKWANAFGRTEGAPAFDIEATGRVSTISSQAALTFLWHRAR